MVIFGVSILIVVCLGNIMVQTLCEYAKTGADWVSALIQALGNVFGGVLGGIVAYIVAKYQIDKQIEIQNKEQMVTTVMKLKLIKEELLDNQAILKSILESKQQTGIGENTFDVGVLISKISNDIWKSNLSDLRGADDLLANLNKIYKKINIYASSSPGAVAIDILEGVIMEIESVVQKITQFNTNVE